MAARIRVLQADVVAKVRSGVGVRSFRQACVELVANAIDAIDANAGRPGPATIEVVVGSGYVSVTDSGSGVAPLDMALIGQRYSTSKQQGGLQHGAGSLGYRGEALASLAAACLELRIVSRFV